MVFYTVLSHLGKHYFLFGLSVDRSSSRRAPISIIVRSTSRAASTIVALLSSTGQVNPPTSTLSSHGGSSCGVQFSQECEECSRKMISQSTINKLINGIHRRSQVLVDTKDLISYFQFNAILKINHIEKLIVDNCHRLPYVKIYLKNVFLFVIFGFVTAPYISGEKLYQNRRNRKQMSIYVFLARTVHLLNNYFSFFSSQGSYTLIF